MLLVYLCRFSQPPSAEVPQQLMLNSYQQFEDIEPAAELLRKQTALKPRLTPFQEAGSIGSCSCADI